MDHVVNNMLKLLFNKCNFILTLKITEKDSTNWETEKENTKNNRNERLIIGQNCVLLSDAAHNDFDFQKTFLKKAV